MTDITTESPDAPAPKPVIQRIMDAIDEVVDQRERASADAARAEVTAAQPLPVPATKAPKYAWNDLWTIERTPPGPVADTETLLNGLIEECGFLMREVSFRLVRAAPDCDMASDHLNRAMALARTGAEVGLTVAKLRKATMAESRQSITLERVERLPEIEKPSIRENE